MNLIWAALGWLVFLAFLLGIYLLFRKKNKGSFFLLSLLGIKLIAGLCFLFVFKMNEYWQIGLFILSYWASTSFLVYLQK